MLYIIYAGSHFLLRYPKIITNQNDDRSQPAGCGTGPLLAGCLGAIQWVVVQGVNYAIQKHELFLKVYQFGVKNQIFIITYMLQHCLKMPCIFSIGRKMFIFIIYAYFAVSFRKYYPLKIQIYSWFANICFFVFCLFT